MKPFSHYHRSASVVGPSWRPKVSSEFERYKRRFKLQHNLVLCADVAKLDNVFCPGSSRQGDLIPFKNHMRISENRRDLIKKTQRQMCKQFKPTLKKLFQKKKRRKSRSRSESEDDRAKDKKKPKKRVLDLGSDSDSSSDDPQAKRQSFADKNSLDYKKERQKNLEKLNNEVRNKSGRKLCWETGDYFKKKNEAGPSSSSQARGRKEDGSKIPKIGKIPKQGMPSTSIQNILRNIEIAKQEQDTKPKVELKIPKITTSTNSTYRPQAANDSESVVEGVAADVRNLLRSNTVIPCPVFNDINGYKDYTVKKIAWWFLKEEEDPPLSGVYHPEFHDAEIHDEWYNPDDHLDDDDVSIGCVSDPEGLDDKLKEEEERRRKKMPDDPDKLDEYCGVATLDARIRSVKDPDPDKPPPPPRSLQSLEDIGELKRYFVMRPGCNYEKANFEAKCLICKDVISGKRQLGAHVRGDFHKDNFRSISIKLITEAENLQTPPYKKIYPARLEKYAVSDALPSTVPAKGSGSTSQDRSSLAVLNHRDRSADTPNAVINDDRPTTMDVVNINDLAEENLSLPSLAQYDIPTDTEQLRAKICLRMNGFWTKDMEERWVDMQTRETRLLDEYNDEREKYIGEPETHPAKEKEWLRFWDKRSLELEQEGKDPNTYDYGTEWVPFWLKRVQEIMKADAEKRLSEMKREFGLDANTLKRICHHHGLDYKTVDVATASAEGSKSRSSFTSSGAKQSCPKPDLKPSNGQYNNNKTAYPPAKKFPDKRPPSYFCN